MIRYFIALLLIILWPVSLWAGQFKVTSILDGDTCVLKGHSIEFKARLIGIDCPEIGQTFALEATNYLKDTILNRTVNLQGFGYGFYNRPLVVVSIDGKVVNLELIKLGYAEAYRRYKAPLGFDRKPYIEAEEVAQEKKLGIWSLGSDYISPSDWRKVQRKSKK